MISIYGGSSVLFLLMSVSNKEQEEATLELALGRSKRTFKEKQISQYSDMMFSWTLGVILTVDILFHPYNAVLGVILICLNAFGVLVTIESKSDIKFKGTVLEKPIFRIVILVGGILMVSVALLNVFVGDWVWPYPFIF
ncbi:hypothetical protein ACFO4O_10835 [Glaciecola siphonariae]|uniref:Uncharacterized protein n=1 Tax=Glaciecola siphonariae TaxID=521012 RepID=A0ABV9LVV1_9ALTE